MTQIGAQPQPYDPQAIREFLRKPNPEKHLVVRTSIKDGKKIKQFEYVETSELTWREKAESLLGMGASSSKKIIKELVKQGLYREDLAKELTARTHNKVGKVLEKFIKPNDIGRVVAKKENRDVMQKAAEAAFGLGKDTKQNEIQHQLILNYLKMGTFISPTTDGTFYSTERGALVHGTPLFIACSQGWVDVVQLLMDRAKDSYNTKLGIQSGLMLNQQLRRDKLNPGLIAALVIKGEQLYENNDEGITRLDKLMGHQDREGVKTALALLVDKGHLVIQDPNKSKEPPLFMRSPKDVVGEYLLEQAAKKAVPPTTPLALAVRTKNGFDMVQRWCESHPTDVFTDRARGGKSMLELAKSDAKDDWRVSNYLFEFAFRQIKAKPALANSLSDDMLIQLRAFASEYADSGMFNFLNQIQDQRTLRKN